MQSIVNVAEEIKVLETYIIFSNIYYKLIKRNPVLWLGPNELISALKVYIRIVDPHFSKAQKFYHL